jgi:transcriptional regulator with XRE-family HTH domain
LSRAIGIAQGCDEKTAATWDVLSHPVGFPDTVHTVSDAEAMWLIAGGEPGAERFGQLVQSLRKGRNMSVEDLARGADLSVGTIRAIEQARRAPSEESGVRLLRVLLPPDALFVGSEAASDRAADITFQDPISGQRILLQFKARTAGDNRRWSSDKPRAGESQVEAFIRKLLADPEATAKWRAQWRAALEASPDSHSQNSMSEVLADHRDRAARPADDADFGRLVRRLATLNEFRVARVHNLLDLWDLVDSEQATEKTRDYVAGVDESLDIYTRVAAHEIL